MRDEEDDVGILGFSLSILGFSLKFEDFRMW